MQAIIETTQVLPGAEAKGEEVNQYLGRYYCEEFGDTEQDAWTEGSYSSITKITVTVKDTLTSLQFQYGLRGVDEPIEGDTHGEPNGEERVCILQPGEFVEKISGYLVPIKQDGHSNRITSLTFDTNKRKLGPYGPEGGEHFETTQHPTGEIVGFSGSSGAFLNGIGVFIYTTCS